MPYTDVDGRMTVPDQSILELYGQLLFEGLVPIVFCQGSVKSPGDLLMIFKKPDNISVFVIDEDYTIGGFAFLNGVSRNSAYVHFCFLKRMWGKKSTEAGGALLNYWFSIPGRSGPLFDVLLGIIPETNRRAIRYIKRLGWTTLGVIPEICYDAYRDQNMGGLVSYLAREDHGR